MPDSPRTPTTSNSAPRKAIVSPTRALIVIPILNMSIRPIDGMMAFVRTPKEYELDLRLYMPFTAEQRGT
jgi:hypothetical protein